MKKQNRKQGFSLVEIMVVVVIIGLLAGVVGAGVIRYLSDARITTAKSQMKAFETALKLYKTKKGSFPKDLEDLTKPDRSGYTFIDTIPEDPWGNSYEYKKKGSSFDIISFGSDGKDGGEGEEADIKFSELNKKEDD